MPEPDRPRTPARGAADSPPRGDGDLDATGGGDGDASDVTRLPPASASPAATPSHPSHSTAGWLTASDAISHGRFAPGTVLAGRYRIVGLLGKGGMGEVYRADDLKLGQPVALKFLPGNLATDPVRLSQFHGEVRLARQISHANICRVYDVDEADGLPFLSMEYVDGEDLASLLRRIGRLPEERAIELGRQLCAGLAAAHERGVLHRDLKPANVMIDGRGQVRVMDFGLAVAAGTAAQDRAGTPAYMAPEQLAGRDVTVRSDIYALGLVLFEMFTGRRALDAKTIAELLRLHESQAITPPTTIVKGLDPAIERAILRCLEREPERRPASALAVAAALPGGDPIAAALAAGETPSPAMVAAAGESDALPLTLAAGGIALVALALIGVAIAGQRTSLLHAAASPKPIDVLIDRAETIRAKLGYADPPRDSFHGLSYDSAYLAHIASTDRARTRWTRLTQTRPAVLTFWYRTSPRPLAPSGTSRTPTPGDPPLTVSGMTSIVTDAQGRLVEFNAVAPQREDPKQQAAAPNWAALFEAADLPMASFTPRTPSWTPRTFADARAAWEGALPEDPATRVVVEAAAYRGRPVYFQLVWPWSRAARMDVAARRTADTVVAFVISLILLALLVGAGFMARGHLRRGRSDRRGADRVALLITLEFFVTWGLAAHHFADLELEANGAFLRVAIGLLNGGIVWLLYLALEPWVRRWRPLALVGWTRLVSGSLRDPQVGRDLLIGTIAGALLAFIQMPSRLMPQLAGQPPLAPVATSFAPLLGARPTLALLLDLLPGALNTAMIVVFVFVVARLILRRTGIVVAVLAAILLGLAAVELSNGPGRMAEMALVLPATAVLFTVVVRFGLLATVVMFAVNNVLQVLPFTANPSAPTFLTSTAILGGVLAVAVFAAYAARAGEPMFRMSGE